MTDQSLEEKETVEFTPLYSPLRKVMLASLGAVVLAIDEATDFVNLLADRGQITQKESGGLTAELRLTRRKSMKPEAQVENIEETVTGEQTDDCQCECGKKAVSNTTIITLNIFSFGSHVLQNGINKP